MLINLHIAFFPLPIKIFSSFWEENGFIANYKKFLVKLSVTHLKQKITSEFDFH